MAHECFPCAIWNLPTCGWVIKWMWGKQQHWKQGLLATNGNQSCFCLHVGCERGCSPLANLCLWLLKLQHRTLHHLGKQKKKPNKKKGSKIIFWILIWHDKFSPRISFTLWFDSYGSWNSHLNTILWVGGGYCLGHCCLSGSCERAHCGNMHRLRVRKLPRQVKSCMRKGSFDCI